jgi:hypothetical protein
MLVTEIMPEVANYAEYIQQDLKFPVIGFGKMGILHSGNNVIVNEEDGTTNQRKHEDHNEIQMILDRSRAIN